MNKVFTSIIFFSFSMIMFNTYSQEEHVKCGINHYMNELYKNDPDLKKRIEKQFETNHVQKSETEDTSLFIIPVVFHILHQNGSENITDAQVMNQMNILNDDYRLRNADTADVVSAFDTIMADSHIEFRLATKDPWGNCTNGIEHIYSHELNTGDANSKVNQWDRARYLNVWVVKSFPQSSLLGYSMYPEAADGNNFYMDGIILKHNTIGTTGTAAGSDGRTLTHEAGHWLNLAHTWGSTNDPGVSCGDDGVLDTPETKGSFVCNLASSVCNSPIIENVQNYMEYTGCSNMFTKGQTTRLRDALRSDLSNRDNLTTIENHIATGIDLTSPPVCAPKAYFYASDRMICQGSNVQFTDRSWQASVTSRTWTFEGGTPATSTSANPTVTYDTPGYKRVTLAVSNGSGTDELVEENFIYVSPLWGDFTGPYSIDMENGMENWFLVNNLENNYAKFQIVDGQGVNNSRCYKLNNHRNIENALTYTNDWFYNKRLGGSVDELISPSFDLRTTFAINVSFDYAYATNGTILTTVGSNEADIKEQVKVYSSKDCGETWSLKKTIDKGTLLTAGFAGGAPFTPQSNSQWKNCSFSYTSTSTDNETRFKIEFIASDVSNNFYVDNFNVTGALGIFSNEIDNLQLTVFPNPLMPQEAINVSYIAGEHPVELIVRNIQGKTIHSEIVNKTNSEVHHTIEMGQSLSSSCYFLEVKSGEFSTVKKVVVL
jgi:PKD repeat protein